jgi:hypothetical protein
MNRRVRPALVATVVALMLGGCTSAVDARVDARGDQVDAFAPYSKTESQERIRETERAVIALLPEHETLDVTQATDDNSLTCADGGVTWTGLATATTAGPPDMRALLQAVRHHWGSEPGYEVEDDETTDGAPMITLSGPYGEKYFIESWESTLDVLSFGPCVRR